MPELAEVETPKNAGYMSRSRSSSKEKIKREEQELKELIAKEQGERVQEGTEEAQETSSSEAREETRIPEEALTEEEKSFKTRYGDVRRHLAAKEKEFDAKIKELESQVTSTKKLVPPKSDEDIAAWAKEYPDVAGIVETIAEKKLNSYLIRLIYS